MLIIFCHSFQTIINYINPVLKQVNGWNSSESMQELNRDQTFFA
jgi:hypothetical protein